MGWGYNAPGCAALLQTRCCIMKRYVKWTYCTLRLSRSGMFIVKRSDGQGLTRNYATKGWSKWIALSCACERVEHLSHQRGRSHGLARPLL